MNFADESSFTLRSTTNNARLRRIEGTRYESNDVLPTFKPGYVSVSVCGLASVCSRSPFFRIGGTLNQSKYMDILHNYALPFKDINHSVAYNSKGLQFGTCGPLLFVYRAFLHLMAV